MIQHRPYDQKVDVYSFGIVLWELVTGNLPFANMTAVQAAFAVVNKGVRPAIPHDCLPALAEIMTRCWDANPDARPPFTEVVRMLEGDGLAERWEASQRADSHKFKVPEFTFGRCYSDLTDDSSLLVQAVELSGPR